MILAEYCAPFPDRVETAELDAQIALDHVRSIILVTELGEFKALS